MLTFGKGVNVGMPATHETIEDVRQVTEAIGRFFEIEGDLHEEDVEKLHSRFVRIVEQVNARLQRCDALLRKGLRSEAIQEAEIDPPLLDMVTELDIPAWDAWAEYVRRVGFPPQPPLLLQIASALNEAYTETQPLEHLLVKHRLHALARSPLRGRLAILRSIAEKDPDNPVWQQDLVAYETARIAELRSELRRLLEAKDAAGLVALYREITEISWLVAPPMKLAEKAKRTIREIERTEARERLTKLNRKLEAAFSAFDVDEARAIREEWNLLAQTAELSKDDPLRLEAEPALEWLDEEDLAQEKERRYQEALARLEAKLDNPAANRAELERQLAEVERYVEEVPVRIRRRYQERIETIDLAHARKTRRLILLALLGIVVAGAGVALIFVHQIRASRRREAVAQLTELVNKHRFAEANALYKRWAADLPYIVETPEGASIKLQIDRGLKQVAARRREYLLHLEMAEELATTPSSWEKLNRAREELEEAAELAPDKEAELRIAEVEQRIVRERIRLQRLEDERFDADVRELRKQMSGLKDLDQPKLVSLLRTAEELQERQHVSDAKKSASALPIVIRQIREQIELSKQRARARKLIVAIEDAIGSTDVFRIRLSNYVADLPEDPRSGDFREVLLKRLSVLDEVRVWNSLADDWNRLDFRNLERSAPIAAPLISSIQKRYSHFPRAAEAVALGEYMKAATERHDCHRDFEELLHHDVFRLNCVVQKRDDGRPVYYYFQGKPRGSGRTLKILQLLRVDDLEQQKELSLLRDTLVPGENNRHYSPAPQVQLAKNCLAVLRNRDTPWEEKICKLASELLRDSRTDPILRFDLLRRVLKIGKKTSPLCREELADLSAMVEERASRNRSRGSNWFATDDENVDRLREQLTDFFATVDIDPMAVYETRIATKLGSVVKSAPFLPKLVWVGMVLRDDRTDEWQCVFGNTVPRDRVTTLMAYSDHNGSKMWTEIGRFDTGRVVFEIPSGVQLVQGQPVFALVTERAREHD